MELTKRGTSSVSISTASVSSSDVWDNNKKKRSRNGSLVLFDDFRMALDGKESKQWGKKVFNKTVIDLGVLEKCTEDHKVSSTYCPTTKAMDKYADMFAYDIDTKQWGIASEALDMWNEEILPHIVSHAKVVRKQLVEVAKIKARARYYENKNVTKELF